MEPKTVYENYRICSLHFIHGDFGRNNRLKTGVVPSLKLGEEKSMKVLVQNELIPKTSSGLPLTLEPVPSTSTVVFQRNDKVSSTSHPSEPANVPGTPKGQHVGLLSEVHVSKMEELTPKAKHLYESAKLFRRRAIASKKIRISLNKRLMQAIKFTKSQMFKEVVSSMDRTPARFFESG